MIAMKRLAVVLALVASFHDSLALTKLWTGLGGDGLWANAANWNNNSLPAAGDDVLLDNSLVTTGYAVTLPNTAVLVKTLTLTPGANDSILLVLPSTNTLAPALTVTGPGYGILVNDRGIFKNASGLSSGASLSIADSIRISNGGRYIHSSKSPSASSIVLYLSKTPGTEKGIFEYDVPGGANYDVSVTKRTYGCLVFSAVAAGVNRTYTGSGSNQLVINGDLQINAGATFNVDLSGANGNIVLMGNYIQNGGVFNIAHVANNTSVKIAGNMTQSAGGVITETDAGLPVMELNGSARQAISLQGVISNSITFRMNNPAGVVLQSPLSLPYNLDLVKGVLTTSSASLLTLAAGCMVSVDSSSTNSSYINGPLRKEGLSNAAYSLFPVGNPPGLQWLELVQASGNFTVEYIKTNPGSLSTVLDTTLKAITNTGYWTITTDANPAASSQVVLSYAGPDTLGITAMTALNVAQLDSGKWISRSNTGTTGSAGAAGSVTSALINPFPVSTTYFTLAAASMLHALAETFLAFSASVVNNQPVLHWTVPANNAIVYFTLLRADSNMQFSDAGVLPAVGNREQYWFTDFSAPAGQHYYRLQANDKDGNATLSKIVSLFVSGAAWDIHPVLYLPSHNPYLLISAAENSTLQITVMNMEGCVMKTYRLDAAAGNTSIPLGPEGLAAGVYQLIARDKKGRTITRRFIQP